DLVSRYITESKRNRREEAERAERNRREEAERAERARRRLAILLVTSPMLAVALLLLGVTLYLLFDSRAAYRKLSEANLGRKQAEQAAENARDAAKETEIKWQKNLEVTQSRLLATEADRIRPDKPQLSTLLAAEAIRRLDAHGLSRDAT